MANRNPAPAQPDRNSAAADAALRGRSITVLAGAAVTVACLEGAGAIGMAVVGNPEGPLGGLLFALMYAAPLLFIAGALRRGTRRVQTAVGWLGALLAAYYTLVVVGNWAGYTAGEAAFALAVTVPTAAVELAVFSWTVLRRDDAAAR